jgi:hypothetical protein
MSRADELISMSLITLTTSMAYRKEEYDIVRMLLAHAT